MADLTQGTVVNNRYTLLEYKGRGSFGEVWLAHDDTLGIDVALKIYISLDQRGVDEFKSEYTTTLGLSHPQLLTASFFDVWESRPFLVMKYCENGSSSEIVGKATELDVWQFIHDVAAGLAYLHGQPEPIIHQDIKPDNILVNTDNRFLITDFGISKRVRSTMRKQSKRAVGAGATAYMGPERFGDDPNPVMASDIWSLGVSAYELATGELPFSGLGGGMQRNGAALPNLPQGWNPNLNDLIRRMMALEPWDRPTARQIADYTEAVLDGNDISFEQWSTPEQAPASKKKLFIGIAIGVVVVIGIALAIIFSAGKKVDVVDNNDDIKTEYAHLMDMCANDVKIGSAQNIESLLEARNLLDSLDQIQDEYPEIFEDDETEEFSTEGLKKDLDSKIDEAQKAYLELGEGQMSINEYEYAIDPLQKAALLKPYEKITGYLNKISSSTGCKAALMAIKTVQLEDGKLLITYDGLNEDRLDDVTLKYTVKDGSKSSNAQATVAIQPGKNRTLTIALRDDAPAKPNEISIFNGGLNFYNGTIK